MDFPFVDFHTHHPKASEPCVVNLPRDGAFPIDDPEPRGEEKDFNAKTRWYCYGIHPWWAGDTKNETRLIEQLLQEDRIAMVGETGVDKAHPLVERQLELFERQIALSERYRKPMVLHNVKGTGEILSLHKKLQPTQVWVIHGFNGTQEEARQLTDRGICVSVGASILYENRKITKSISSIPLEFLLLETDEALMPVSNLYQRASELLEIPLEVLKRQIFTNFARIMS